MKKLLYKASFIARAERETGKKFFEVLGKMDGDLSFDDLMFLFKAGGASEEDFDQIVASGLENAIIEIMDGLNDSGFLGSQKIDTAELRSAMKNSQTSSDSGETSKKTPSKSA